MGGILFGKGGKATAPTPIATSLRIQSSLYGKPIPIGAGQNRASGNVVWYGDFLAKKAKQAGGKGGVASGVLGKGSGASYNYSASFIVSLAQGPRTLTAVYNSNAVDFIYSSGSYAPSSSVLAALATLGVSPTYGNTYGLTEEAGNYPQSAWSYLSSAHASQALTYPGQHLCCFANFQLGSSPTVPSFSFEAVWPISASAGSPGFDVNPGDWISAFLTNADWGVPNFPANLVASFTTGAGDPYTFWRAYGLFISPVLTDASAANSHLADLMKATACDFKWSGGMLSVLPYADQAQTGNGATFTPNTTPVFALTDLDFLPNSSGGASSSRTPILVELPDPSDILNVVPVEYLDRSNLYNPVTYFATDEAAVVAANVERQDSLRACHFFCLASAAVPSAWLQLQRERVIHGPKYTFTLPAQFARLEIGDIVSIQTATSPMFAAPKIVRCVEITENSDRSFTVKAENMPATIGLTSPASQSSLGYAANANADPGAINPPVFFEPPGSLATNEVWGAISGVGSFWGGANIWISVDGTNYTLISSVAGKTPQGVLTSTLPTYAYNPAGQTVDSTNTLAVNMTESASTIDSVSSAAMSALLSLAYCDGELIAYENANLTSAFHYGLTPIVRGAYGTAIGSHASGSQFAILNGAQFQYAYDPGLIGQTIYIKVQSFNVYGGGAPDLSTLTPYTYTIAGSTPMRTDHYNSFSVASGGTTLNFDKAAGTGSPVPFVGGPNGSALPYVNVTWSVTAGDTLVVTSLGLSSVHLQIMNGGSGVARTVNATVSGY